MNRFQRLARKIGGYETGCALAFYAVWTVVATYPLAFAPADHIENWGDPLLNVWIMAWDLHQLAHDPLRLFDAPIFYPAHNTLALSEVLIAQALQAAPIVALTGNFILAYNLIVIVSFVLCGLGAYWLTREVLPPAPSLVAGAAYAFSFYRVGEYSHLQILSAQWIPFAILALLRLWRKPSGLAALALGLMVSLQFLSSFYLGLFLTITLAFLLAGLIVAQRQRLRPAFLLGLTGAALVAVIAVLPFALPYFRVEREFQVSRTLGDAIGGSAIFGHYLTVPPTSLLYGDLSGPLLRHWQTDETLFGGVIPLSLAIIGLIGWRKRRWVAFFAGLAAFGLILSLGPRLHWGGQATDIPLPYALLYDGVPGFRSIRVVGRIGVMVTLGLAGLAAMGAARVLAWAPRRLAVPLGVGLALAVSAETLAIPTRMTPVEPPDRIPPVYRWLAAQPDRAPMLELPTIESRWLDRAEELERQGHEQYLSIYHWHPTPSGYSGFAPPRFWSVLLQARAFPTAQSIGFFQCTGVEYLVFHADQYPPERWQSIAHGLGRYPDQIQPLAQFGSDHVYRLAAPTSGIAPTPNIRLPSMIQAGKEYRGFLEWENAGDPVRLAQTDRITVRGDWSGQAISTTIPAPTCLEPGATTVPFDLAAPKEPGSYHLTVTAAGATGQAVIEVSATPRPEKIEGSSVALQLQQAAIQTPEVKAGGTVLIDTTWQLRRWTGDAYLLGAEVINGQGQPIASATIDPFQGELPTLRWLPGETVSLSQGVILPRDLAPGAYTLRALVRYADGVLWKLADPAGNDADHVVIGSFQVR